DQIKAALVAEYGDRVLATPRSEGIGLAAWVVPTAAFLAACALIAAAALRWRRRRPQAGQPAAATAPAGDSDRLDADLERYEL
ncbi:MAG TPA: cytochrome c-type biogenesis protein CcmH, partial [Thermoleophilaceae bacterium]